LVVGVFALAGVFSMAGMVDGMVWEARVGVDGEAGMDG